MRVTAFKFGISLMTCLAVLVTAPIVVDAAETGAPEASSAAPELYVVRIEVADQAEVEFLAHQMDVWAVYLEDGYLDAGVGADELEALID